MIIVPLLVPILVQAPTEFNWRLAEVIGVALSGHIPLNTGQGQSGPA